MTINLDEIEKALNEATPGPWECDERVGCISVHPKQDANCICDVTDQVAYWNGFMEDGCWNVKESDSKNAHLIANAPEWLWQLVERVRKLESAMKELQDDPYVYNVPRLVGIIQNTLDAKEHPDDQAD